MPRAKARKQEPLEVPAPETLALPEEISTPEALPDEPIPRQKDPERAFASDDAGPEGPELKAGYKKHFPTVPKLLKVPSKIFGYWRSVWEDVDLRERLTVYVYRLYPVVDMRLAMNEQEASKCPREVHQIARIMDDEPWTFDDLKQRCGSGAYHIKINDTAIKSAKRTVTMTTFQNEFIIQDSDYPPVVDPKTVLWDHPGNSAYRIAQRSRGLPAGPGEYDVETENEEMAQQTAATEVLTGAVGAMADRLADMADKRVEEMRARPNEQAAPQSPAGAEAVLKIVSDGATTAMNMVKEAQSEIQRRESQSADPIAMVKAIAELVKPAAPNPPQDMTPFFNTVLEQQRNFFTLVVEGQKERLAALERTLEAQRNQKPASLLDQLSEVVTAFTKVKEALGPSAVEEAASAVAGNGKWYERALATLAPRALDTVNNIASAYMMSKLPQGATMPNQNPQAMMDAQPGALPAATPQQANGQPMPPLNPDQAELLRQRKLFAEYAGLMGQVENKLLQYFNQGATGADFADWIIDVRDWQAYAAIRDLGQQFVPADAWAQLSLEQQRKESTAVLIELMKTRPNIWQVASTNPKFSGWLTEFMNHDEIRAAEENEPEGDELGAGKGAAA